jgi:hypothetical protein
VQFLFEAAGTCHIFLFSACIGCLELESGIAYHESGHHIFGKMTLFGSVGGKGSISISSSGSIIYNFPLSLHCRAGKSVAMTMCVFLPSWQKINEIMNE